MKKVLLTGASGFIGRHVIAGLKKRGYEVHAISRKESQKAEGVYWYKTDLFDLAKVELIFEQVKPSHLLHLAWNVKPNMQYMTSTDNFRWVKGGLSLIEFFKENGGKRAVFAGTCAEYDWQYGVLKENLTPCAPTTNYGVCKLALNQMIKAFCQSGGISLAWGRVFFVYGPHEDESRLVGSIVKALLQKKRAACTSGEQYRDFLYVEDVADAFCALLDNSVSGDVNIASGSPVKIREVVQSIADLLGQSELLDIGGVKLQKTEAPLLCANIERLTTEVGWKPQYDINSGIAKTIQWWTEELDKNN